MCSYSALVRCWQILPTDVFGMMVHLNKVDVVRLCIAAGQNCNVADVRSFDTVGGHWHFVIIDWIGCTLVTTP
jgi:hypothetical protein